MKSVNVNTVRERIEHIESLNAKGAGTAIESQQFELACLHELLACLSQPKMLPVGVMIESKFANLQSGASRFIALWPRPGIAVYRSRPEDGVLVYARVGE